MISLLRSAFLLVLAAAVGLAAAPVGAQERVDDGRTVRVVLDVGVVGATEVRVTPPAGGDPAEALIAAETLVRSVGTPVQWLGGTDDATTGARLDGSLAEAGGDEVTLALDTEVLEEAARTAGFRQVELVVCHDPLPAQVVTEQGGQSSAVGRGDCGWGGQRWVLGTAGEPVRATLTLDAGGATRGRALALLAVVLLGVLLLGAAAGALAATLGRAAGRATVLAAVLVCLVPAGAAVAYAVTASGLVATLALATQDAGMLRLVPLIAVAGACASTVAGAIAGVWLAAASRRRDLRAWLATGGWLPEEGLRVYTLEEAAAALQLSVPRAARLLGAGVLRWGQDQQGNTGVTARSLAAERRVRLNHRSRRTVRRAVEVMLGPIR
jgi:hypothetical protein